MSPEVLGIHEDWTAAEAMEVVRARIDGPETVYLLPVVGPGRVLRGVVSWRNLIAADEDTVIEDIVRDSLSTHALTDREEAAGEFLSHRLIAMPVTDQEDRLVGILTMDDVLDIIDEEDAEDFARGSRYRTAATGRICLRRSCVWCAAAHRVAARPRRVCDPDRPGPRGL